MRPGSHYDFGNNGETGSLLTRLHQEKWKLPEEDGYSKFGSGKVRLWSTSEGKCLKGTTMLLSTTNTLGGYN